MLSHDPHTSKNHEAAQTVTSPSVYVPGASSDFVGTAWRMSRIDARRRYGKRCSSDLEAVVAVVRLLTALSQEWPVDIHNAGRIEEFLVTQWRHLSLKRAYLTKIAQWKGEMMETKWWNEEVENIRMDRTVFSFLYPVRFLNWFFQAYCMPHWTKEN